MVNVDLCNEKFKMFSILVSTYASVDLPTVDLCEKITYNCREGNSVLEKGVDLGKVSPYAMSSYARLTVYPIGIILGNTHTCTQLH